MRALLIAIILAIWALLGWCYYQDAQECCDADTSSISQSTSTNTTDATTADMVQSVDQEAGTDEILMDGTDTNASIAETDMASDANNTSRKSTVTGPILFKWNESGPVIDDGSWPQRMNTLTNNLNDNQKMEITGLYRSGEENTSTYENLGLARAHATRDLFTDLPDDRFILQGKLVDEDVDRSSPFVSVRFANRTVTETIVETEDKTLIYFPFNSTNKLNDIEVETYLDKVAQRVKSSGEKIRLTGHTDSVGSTSSNQVLGQWRADVVRDYLVSKGVPANRITALSKGERDPIASNRTKDGRSKNRRTELEIY